MQFTVIGIPDKEDFHFSPDCLKAVAENTVFSGGKRHYQLVKHILPEGHLWIDITIPLKNVFEQYKAHKDILVFASGDPLFFGFANTIKRELPKANISLMPFFNSLQLLAHRLVLPYHDMINVSLTGRPFHEFDRVLIEAREKIGLLTDKKNTPQAIAQRMIDYGYTNYEMIIGENLGGENERIQRVLLSDAAKITHSDLNCIILLRTEERRRYFGIPEQEINILDGRPKMITKMPIRLLSLSFLDLYNRSVMWDIGFCTGSVSIEAKLQFPHLKIHSFEVREESRELIKKNTAKFGAPGIEAYIGDFFTKDLTAIEKPDAVFIGGHGGKLVEMLEIIKENILAGGIVVFNSVSKNSKDMFLEGVEKYGFKIIRETRIIVDENNPIDTFAAVLL
jgi:precorrin-6Y C5,15-methyltransferase (decarboxylating)